jgi:lysozyme
LNAGCSGGNYCPDNNVTRDHLALMLLGTRVPPNCTGVFTDVACPSTYANWIEEVYREGIVPACQTSPSLKYCPTGTVTETQMLTYLNNVPNPPNCPVPGVPCYHPIAGGSTYTFRDQQNRVVTEFYGPFASRDNIFLGNVLVASYVDKQPTVTGNWQFHVSDHLGTLRLSVNSSNGNPVESHKYWPYGDDVSGGAPSQRLSFAAMERDTEANHYYDHARSHDFNLGRFISPDPLTGKPRNPQSWNGYSYTPSNPINYTDPLGLMFDGIWMTFRQGQQDSSPPSEPLSTKGQEQQTLSSNGLGFIERHEGFSAKVYKDSAGNSTIGYGHLIKKGEDFSKGITKEKAGELLAQDAKTAVDAVNANVTTTLSQSKFDAVVDFTYNVGGGNFGKSTLLKNINAGNDVTKENFTDWNRAGGKVVEGLTTRRTDEFNLYSKGDYGGP